MLATAPARSAFRIDFAFRIDMDNLPRARGRSTTNRPTARLLFHYMRFVANKRRNCARDVKTLEIPLRGGEPTQARPAARLVPATPPPARPAPAAMAAAAEAATVATAAEAAAEMAAAEMPAPEMP